MNKKIIIGARGSKLSLSYVEKVKKLFFLASGKEKETEIKIIGGFSATKTESKSEDKNTTVDSKSVSSTTPSDNKDDLFL